MANKDFNKQTTNSLDSKKSSTDKGTFKALSKPKYEQVKSTKPTQKNIGKGFKSKSEMIDKI